MGRFGQAVKQGTLDDIFLTGPGEDLVAKTLLQMSKTEGVPNGNSPTFPFQILFGPYTPGSDQQRWADYQRFDWTIRQLPVINIFEGQTQDRTSDQGWLNGSISFQVYWPPSQRRSDLSRIQKAFEGIMEMFFSSRYVKSMLDEIYYIQREEKVYGLNEYGKQMTWSPNVEGMVEAELVPVTIVDVKYRIDLRSWYRALEFQDRTKDEPFKKPLSDLAIIGGEYDGEIDNGDTEYVLKDEIGVSNP